MQPKSTPVFDSYWAFAAERQSIFHARVAKLPPPWTRDPILQVHKFTNAYRAADRVSQYLIRNVVYGQDHSWETTILRILLFKIFNKIETWELIESQVGQVTMQNFIPDRISRVLNYALDKGASIYSGAYIMPSGPASMRRFRKHMMHVDLVDAIVRSSFSVDLARTASMEKAYELLVSIPSFGPFLAFQFLIDLNYSEYLNFSEMDFVVPGPGARDGIHKCFVDLGDYSTSDVIRWVAERQDEEFSHRDLKFHSLWGRPLQLIDCQNLFCEVDKYARVAHPDIKGRTQRSRIKQKFKAKGDYHLPWFPPKWHINESITLS